MFISKYYYSFELYNIYTNILTFLYLELVATHNQNSISKKKNQNLSTQNTNANINNGATSDIIARYITIKFVIPKVILLL